MERPDIIGCRGFSLSTPSRSGNFSVFPNDTPKRAEARAPINTNNMGTHGWAGNTQYQGVSSA
jgi:hypothetical protein